MSAIGYLSGALRVSTLDSSQTFGARTHITGWMAAARHLGHDVHPYIVGDLLGASRPALQDEGKVRGNRAKTAAVDLVRIGANAVNSRRGVRALGPARIDLAYERYAAFQSLGRAHARAGTPWVLETNGLYFEEAARDRASLSLVGPARRSELAAYRDADLLVCVTEQLAELIETRMGSRRRRGPTVVVPNGVDTARFAASPREPRPGEPLRVGFVGSVVRWMNLERLLEAGRILAGEGQPLEIVIVGAGAALPELEAAAAAHARPGLAVTFTGALPHPAVPEAIAGFDLCFSGHLPLTGLATMYHSPLKIYEYLSVGRRVLLPDYPFARELAALLPGVEVFDPLSTGDLLRAMRALVQAGDSPADAARRRDYVLDNHSWESRVSATLRAAGLAEPARPEPGRLEPGGLEHSRA